MTWRLRWRNWWAGHRLVTINHVARVAQRIANERELSDHPGAAHWLALDKLMRELAK